MDTLQASVAITSGIGLLLELVILVTLLIYMIRIGSADSKLLFAGSGVGLIVRVSYIVMPLILPLLGQRMDIYDPQIALTQFYTYVGVIAIVGYIFHCIGMILLVQRLLQSASKTTR